MARLASGSRKGTLPAMNLWFRRGARGGRDAGYPRMRSTRAWRWPAAAAVCVAAVWSGPAAASVLYRCADANGVTAYVSHPAGYRQCVKVGEWNARPARARAARPIAVADKVERGAKARPPQVLQGPRPKSVGADPAILKITPLGDDAASTPPEASAPPPAWQPLPVVALDTLASWVLPRMLGVELAPVRAAGPTPASAASVPASAASSGAPPEATAPIPLQPVVAPKPPRTGAVYRVVQKNGTVLYTNIASLAKGHDAKMLFTYIIECYACNVHSKIDWNSVPLHLADYGADVRAASSLSGVDVALLRAVIHAESGFNPRALSYKGAQGLMQLMPGTAFELGVGDAFDPAQNISGGARYLAMLLRDFHGDVQLAAAAYNAGAAAVTKYRGVPPYAETQVYVRRVALLYERYRKALAAHGVPELAAARRAD